MAVHTEPALPVWDTSEERIGPTLGCVNSSRVRAYRLPAVCFRAR